MQAMVLDAEWAPRPDARVTSEQALRKWAVYANEMYRNPNVVLTTIPDPEGPGPNELIVKVAACGLCGSDVHMFETDDEGYMLLPYHLRCPVITGHEFSGSVVAVGSDIRQFREGDLVTVEEIQWCGRCTACRGGYWNQCDRVEDLGFTIDGGFAEYVRVDEKHCWSLNKVYERYGSAEIALEVGAMSEPTSVAYEGMFTRAGGFKPGSAVAVFGGGPIGLAAVALANAAGASDIVCVEPLPGRRALAEKLGATSTADPTQIDPGALIDELTAGQGVAMAVECSGNYPIVMPVIERSLALGGKVAVIGMDARVAPLRFIDHQLKAASTYGSLGHCGSWDFPNVIALMASGKISLEHAITRRYPLADLVAAVDETKNRSDGKILVRPGTAPS